MKKILSIMLAFGLFLGVGLMSQKEVQAAPPELSCNDFELGVRYERIWQGQSVTISLMHDNDGTVDVWGETGFTDFNLYLGMQGGSTDWNLSPFPGGSYDYHYNVNDKLVLNPNQKTALFSIEPGQPGTPFGFYFGNRQIKLGFNVMREGMGHGTEELWCEKEAEFEVLYETHIFDDEPPRSDYVYRAGDELSILFEGLPTNYNATQGSLLFQVYGGDDNVMLSSGVGFNNTSDPGGDYGLAPEICFRRNIVEGLTEDIIMGESVWCMDLPEPIHGQTEFTGTVNADLAPGAVHFVLTVTDATAPQIVIGPKPFNDGGGGPDSNMIILGLENIAEAEEAMGLTLPDLLSQNDLYNTNLPATFGKPGVGSITFEPGLNILGNLEQFAALATDFSIEYDEENNRLKAEVNTETLSFLAGIGAVIQFENAMALLGAEGITAENILDFIDIVVYDGGSLVEDLTGYLDLANVEYDPETDILTIPVNHFTEYQIRLLGDTEEIPETGVYENFGWLMIVGVMLVGSTYIVRKKLRA